MVTSTSFEKLKPALERSWSLLGIPDQVTHDNGPPYNSSKWRSYAMEKGFELNPCTPEHPKSNSIVERFMGVLAKTVHAAVALGKDPQTEVQRRLMNYRNTPHPSTGKSPSELIMNRKLKTKIPARLALSDSQVHQEAKLKDKSTRLDRKAGYDKKHRVKEQQIQPGDKVLIKQQKTTVKPPFDPKPYCVTEVKGTQVTAVRGRQKKVRNKEKVKVLKDRPKYLQGEVVGLGTDNMEEEEDDEDMYINLNSRQPSDPAEEDIILQVERVIQEEMMVIQEERELAGADHGEQGQPRHQVGQQAHGQGTPRREKWQVAHGPWREKPAKLSPRERKRRQQEARKRDKEEKDMPYRLRSRKRDHLDSD